MNKDYSFEINLNIDLNKQIISTEANAIIFELSTHFDIRKKYLNEFIQKIGENEFL